MKLKQSEHQEQVMLCRWLDMMRIPYAAIPNGGYRGKITGRRLKDEGMAKGMVDLFIWLPMGPTIALEMKAIGGRVRPEQKTWIDFFNCRPGFVGIVAYGADNAIELIKAIQFG